MNPTTRIEIRVSTTPIPFDLINFIIRPVIIFPEILLFQNSSKYRFGLSKN